MKNLYEALLVVPTYLCAPAYIKTVFCLTGYNYKFIGIYTWNIAISLQQKMYNILYHLRGQCDLKFLNSQIYYI